MTLNTLFFIVTFIFLVPIFFIPFYLVDIYYRSKRRMQRLKLDEYDESNSIGVMIPEGQTAVYALRQTDQKAIPYAWVLVTGIDDTPTECTLWMIYVREKHRGRGYAKQLIRYLQSRYDTIYTCYERGLLNSPGVRLCVSCGFELKAQLFKNQPGQLIWKKGK